jgi:hypothetical protein
MVKDIGGGWKEMEDSDAHAPDAHCFYYNVEKKQKQWGYPE